MTPETLALDANLALYSSMIVYTLAMLTFAWHLATRTAASSEAAAEQDGAAAREPVLAVAGPLHGSQGLRDSPGADQVPGGHDSVGPGRRAAGVSSAATSP